MNAMTYDSADAHLTALAAELASAEACDPPDPGRVAANAWEIFGELCETARARVDAEHTLGQAITAAQAAVADARAGSPDPLAHVRRFLTPRGKMPPAGVTSLAILAWQGPPPPGRTGQRLARCRSRFPVLARRLARGATR